MPLPVLPEPPKPEKGRTVGKPGAKTSNCRPAANLQSSLNNSPYDACSRNPLRSAKTVLSKNTADSLPPDWKFPIWGPAKRTPNIDCRALISRVEVENPPSNFGTKKN